MAVIDDRPSRGERIETAVQRELARRRRLMILYVVLLLIPLGVGGWFLYAGISAPVPVPPSDNRQFEEQNARIDTQQKQVEELTRTQKDLQVQVKKVGSTLQDFEPRLMANAPRTASVEIAAVHSGIDARLESLDERIKRIEETQASLIDQQKKILTALDEIRRVQPVRPAGPDRLDVHRVPPPVRRPPQ